MYVSNDNTNDRIVLIEIAGEDAGLAVPDAVGVRFYSGSARFHALDGRRFARIADLRRAAMDHAASVDLGLKGLRGLKRAS
jgi:hypothetical protein